MRITAKLSVAGAAAIFGVVIAAGGAFAVGGSTMVPDAPGHALHVLGVGAPSAGQNAASIQLKLLASAAPHGQIEKVIRADARPIDGSTDAVGNASGRGNGTPAHKHGSGSTLPDKSVRDIVPTVPAIPAIPALPGETGDSATPTIPAIPNGVDTPSIRPLPHGPNGEK